MVCHKDWITACFPWILSDLVEHVVLGSLSICSSLFEIWMFSDNACKRVHCASYAQLWLVNIMLSLFWLSVDRYLFITDIKCSTYKMGTKTSALCRLVYFVCTKSACMCVFASFMCKFILPWFMLVVYSFAPIVAWLLRNAIVCLHFECTAFGIVLRNHDHYHYIIMRYRCHLNSLVQNSVLCKYFFFHRFQILNTTTFAES